MLAPAELLRAVWSNRDNPDPMPTLRIATAFAVVMEDKNWAKYAHDPDLITAAAMCLLAVWGHVDEVLFLRRMPPAEITTLCFLYLRERPIVTMCCAMAEILPFGSSWANDRSATPTTTTLTTTTTIQSPCNDDDTLTATNSNDDTDDDSDDDNDMSPGTRGILHVLGLVPEEIIAGTVQGPFLDASQRIALATQFCRNLVPALQGPLHTMWRKGAIILAKRGISDAYDPPVARVIGQTTISSSPAAKSSIRPAVDGKAAFRAWVRQCPCRKCMACRKQRPTA